MAFRPLGITQKSSQANNVLVQIGTRRYRLPSVEVKLTQAGDFLAIAFLHSRFHFLKGDGKSFVPIAPEDERAFTTAFAETELSLSPQLPPELSAALQKLPRGYYLKVSPEGYRLVRQRTKDAHPIQTIPTSRTR